MATVCRPNPISLDDCSPTDVIPHLCNLVVGNEVRTSLWQAIKQARVARLARQPSLPPINLTIDEADLIPRVAMYMLRQRGLTPSAAVVMSEGLKSIWEMMTTNSGHLYSPNFPWRRSLSSEDLGALAPYIDEWIAGKAPPQDLPAEYEDWRPQALQAFKERMLREGLWPQTLKDSTSSVDSGPAKEIPC
jgi:hypothetical protein